MLNQTAYAHIVIDEQDVPYLAGTETKAIELVLNRMAYGWSAEEMHLQHPHLTLGQIHSALAYYWDHQDELDEEIQRRLEYVEGIRSTSEPTRLVKRLKAQGLLP